MPARLAAAVLAVLLAHGARAQAPPALAAEVAAADSALAAFNGRDLDALGDAFAADPEFYHDRTGLTDHADTLAAFRGLFAREDGLRRERVGDLEVHPVPGHGAVAVGEHRVCHAEAGAADCGTFPFVMVWRRDADRWRVSRVVSVGH